MKYLLSIFKNLKLRANAALAYFFLKFFNVFSASSVYVTFSKTVEIIIIKATSMVRFDENEVLDKKYYF